jgi:hypothetical protein
MRYATAHDSAFGQARSRRIGRCARCHAPVLADEEHYGRGDQLVHGACGAQPVAPAAARPPARLTARPGLAAAARPPRRRPPGHVEIPVAGRPGPG